MNENEMDYESGGSPENDPGVDLPDPGADPGAQLDNVEAQEGGPHPLEPGGARFEQIYGSLKAYKAFGKPEEVQAKLDRLERMEAVIAERRRMNAQQAVNSSDSDSDTARAEDAKIRQELEKLYPGLKDVESIRDIMSTNLDAASRHFGTLLKRENINLKPEYLRHVENILLSEMTQEQKRSLRFGDRTILDEFVRENLKSGFLSIIKAAAKPSTPTPPTTPHRVGAGGTPPKPPGDGPRTWGEAGESAYARLTASE